MKEIVIGNFIYSITNDKVEEIYNIVQSHTKHQIKFNYTNEETSYLQKINNEYIIYIKEDTKNINDILVHELLHILQHEDGMTESEILKDISDEDFNLISSLMNIILDYDIDQQLNNIYKYNTVHDHIQFNTWFPLIRNKKDSSKTISKYDIKYFAVNFFGVMILDSKNNCEKLLRYADQYTLEIRKIVYHLNDCFKLYDVGNRVDSCKTIYEECAKALGIF